MAFLKHILLMKVRLVIDVEELSLKTPLLKSRSRLNKTNSSRFKELADEGKKNPSQNSQKWTGSSLRELHGKTGINTGSF